jgi:hypothetical protein
MGQKVKPFDKRAAEAVPRSKIKVSQDYHPRRISELIRTESEFRFYEAQGMNPEQAAAEWLKNWGQGTLPTRDELQECVNAKFETVSKEKGGTACTSQSTN